MFSFAIFFTIFFLSFFLFFSISLCVVAFLLCSAYMVLLLFFFIYLHKNENPDSVVVAASVFSSIFRELWQLCCCWVL
jgi:hypothetical protein